jgi:hypothetical protein
MSRYHPAIVPQRNTGSCSWTNCVAATHACLVDYSTKGAKHVAPKAIRDWWGHYCPGISFPTARDAVKALRGVNMTVQWNLPWSTFFLGLRNGRAYDISILYSVVHAWPQFDSAHGFNGRHSVAAIDARWNAGVGSGRWEILIADPLADGFYDWVPKGPQWWPATALVKKAAEASSGLRGYVNVSATIDTVP